MNSTLLLHSLAYSCLAMALSSACIGKGFTWDTKALSAAPRVFPCNEVVPQGVKALYYNMLDTPELRAKDQQNSDVQAIYYEGTPFKGKSTRVFAWVGVPKNAKNAPGIVLVHGGGGTAFESWVRLWNARGYAAIAMDNCGCLPLGTYGSWPRHEWAGPFSYESSFTQINLPQSEQWPYHSVANIMLANSLLRSMPGVDNKNIGITGISWGGYLTCIASGADKRFKYSVPVYGCGFLADNSVWKDQLTALGAENTKLWTSLDDPSVYLPKAKMAMLWVDGTNDFAYPMDSVQKSYRLPEGKKTLCIRINMPHGHGGAGELPAEILAFADANSRKGLPLTTIKTTGSKVGLAWVTFQSSSAVKEAVLCYTTDAGHWPDKKWQSIPADIKATKAIARIPANTRVYYFNLTDERGLLVSSEHVEL